MNASAAPLRGGRPLRLLLVTHSLGGGGAERFAVTLAGALDRQRFTPVLCAATGREDYGVPAGVEVAPHLGYRRAIDLPGTVRRLRRLLSGSRFDIVLSNVLATNCLTAAALGGMGGSAAPPPWVARVGNAPGLADPPLQRLYARRAYRRAARVVCNAEAMAAAFEQTYPGTAGRVTSLPNPTDFERIETQAGPEVPAGGDRDSETGGWPVDAGRAVGTDAGAAGSAGGAALLLWVGRLNRQKRPDLAIEVLARLRRDTGRDVRLRIAGEGPLEGEVRRLAAAAGAGEAVELPGFVGNPFAEMRRADLLLLTSDFEGLPNALIEAQGLGLPAVATRCPFGPEEIVEDGVTGRLAPVGDAAALAAAAAELLAAGPETRRRMAEAARRRARDRYGLAAAVPRWERLLAEVSGSALTLKRGTG